LLVQCAVTEAQAVRVGAVVYSMLEECLLCLSKETEKKSTFFL
jgi:hypothetical protein